MVAKVNCLGSVKPFTDFIAWGYKCGGSLPRTLRLAHLCKGYLSGTWQSKPWLDFSTFYWSDDGVLTMALITGYKSFKGEESAKFITDLHRCAVILLIIIFYFCINWSRPSVCIEDWDEEEYYELIGYGRYSIWNSIPRYSNITGKVKEGAIKGRFLDKLIC